VHKTRIIGGSLLDPEVTWLALVGTAVAATPIKILGHESLTQVLFMAPLWDELVEACASMTVCAALAQSANDVEVKLRGMVCIPLLLAEAEMNSASKKPVDLMIAFLAVMAAHDALPGQAPTSDKALVHLRYVVQFFWAAHKKMLPALFHTVGYHDERIQAWATALHTDHSMPASMTMKTGLGLPDATMQGMTSSLAILIETITARYMLSAVREEKKANGFKKLGSHHQRIILNSSTVDDQ
jgi:hypothetical protein